MKKLRFLVSLITKDNDYQIEQANVATETARRLGHDIEIIFAGNDPINQSQQLLTIIQSPGNHPDAVLIEPVGGTGLPHVAKAAVSAGMGWVVLNRDVDYIPELRRVAHAPVFGVSTDHLEIGRIQGRHVAALTPIGGTVVYIHGPSTSSAVRQRTIGMQEAKPEATKIIVLRGQWTEESSRRAVSAWMLLSTSQKTPIDMIAAQNDDMAMGARKAIQDHTNVAVREKWLSLPFTGVDGLPNTGQDYVRRGLLAATVITPAITALALEALVGGFQKGSQPAELIMSVPVSFPSIADLGSRHTEKPRPHAT
jgi:ribose transport system substrate-binding protein